MIRSIPLALAIPFAVLLVAASVWAAWPALRRRDGWWQLLGLLCLGAIGAYRISDPWWYTHDFNGALVSIAGRNFLTRGFEFTHGVELWNGGAAEPLIPRFYAHHPPLSSWVLVPGFALFGVRESVARLTTLLPSLAALALLFRALARKGLAVGPLGWALAAAMPAFAYYIRSAGYEPMAVALCAMSAAVFVADRGGRGEAAAAAVLGALLVLSGWSGCLFAGMAGLCLMLLRRWRLFLPFAGGALAGALTVAAVLGTHYRWDFTPLIEQFHRRGNAIQLDGGGQIASPLAWLTQGIGRHIAAIIGWPMLALAAAGAPWLRSLGVAKPLIWLLVSATALCLVLRQWVFVHEFTACHFALPTLLLGLAALQRIVRNRGGALVAAAVGLILAVGLSSSLWQTTIRYHKLVGYRHAQRLGAQVRQATQPGDVLLLAEAIPSPIFLYYANRDFVVWPNAAVDGGYRPAAFVQLGSSAALDPRLRVFLQGYATSAVSPRIMMPK